MIPKKLHMIWVGDEAKCPHDWIASWKENHPDWSFRLWGNAELENRDWQTGKQIAQLAKAGKWSGVADCMRYEILFEHGGFYADADSVSRKPLDDFLLQSRMFAAYENEAKRPGLIANCYIGSVKGHIILAEIIAEIASRKDINRAWSFKPPFYRRVKAWKATGPKLLTRIARRHPEQIVVWPSILFLPSHHADPTERASNLSYADHFWGSHMHRPSFQKNR